MKPFIVIPVLLLLAACSSAAEIQQRRTMEEIEKQVQLPAGAEKLEAYARYYAMDRNRVVGRYIARSLVDPENVYYDLPAGQNRWIADHRNLPLISDGGCSVVDVVYDPAKQRVEQASCNGVA